MVENPRYDVNKAKLEVIADTLDAFYCHLFLRFKQTGSCLTIWVTTVTGVVLLAKTFCDFCVHVTMVPPLTFTRIEMVIFSPFPYSTYLSA